MVFVLVLVSPSILAQYGKHYNIWHFGKYAGLDFSTSPPKAIDGGRTCSTHGVAVWCDNNGQLVLYTDGVTIWNGQHQVIAGGADLGGGNSSYQTLIMLIPATSRQFYVFSVPDYSGAASQSRQVHYARVDMTANNGQGAVVKRGVFGGPYTSVAMTAVVSCDPDKNWFIYPDVIGPVHVYQVHSKGLTEHAAFKIPYSGRIIGIKYHSKTGSIAILTDKGILLAQFDANKGKLTPIHFIKSDLVIYGLEFSPGGRFLYFTELFLTPPNFAVSRVNQIDITVRPVEKIEDSKQEVGFSKTRSNLVQVDSSRLFGQLQLGPDGKIYIAKNYLDSLSVINRPDNPGTSCNFVDNAIYLQYGKSTYGLPNNLQIPESVPLDTPIVALVHDIDPCRMESTFSFKLKNYNYSIPYEYDWRLDGKKLPEHRQSITLDQREGTLCLTIRFFDKCIPDRLFYTDTLCYEIRYPERVNMKVRQAPRVRCDSVISPIVLSASGGTPPYQYALAGGGFSSDSIFGSLKTGRDYLFVVRDSNGCNDTLRYSIQQAFPPKIRAIQTKDDYCNLHTGKASIGASGVGELTYSLDGKMFAADTVFEHLPPGKYRAYVKDSSGCLTHVSFVIGTSSLEDYIDTRSSVDTCQEGRGVIRIIVGDTSLHPVFSIGSMEYGDKTHFDHLHSGQYTLHIKDSLGCSFDTVVYIAPTDPPIINNVEIGEIPCFVTRTDIQLDIRGGTSPVRQSLDSMELTTDLHFANLKTGRHLLLVKDALGCTTDTTIFIRASEEDCGIYIPNTFTPNSDDINEKFRIYTDEHVGGIIERFTIYDRWGEILYTAQNSSIQTTGWDGKFKGREMLPGVYLYVIDVKVGEEVMHFSGDITLIR